MIVSYNKYINNNSNCSHNSNNYNSNNTITTTIGNVNSIIYEKIDQYRF